MLLPSGDAAYTLSWQSFLFTCSSSEEERRERSKQDTLSWSKDHCCQKRYFLLHPRHSFLLTAKYSQQTETCLSPQHQFKLLTWQKTSKFGLASGQTKPCSQTKPEHRQGRGHNWGYKQGLRFQWSFNTRKLLGQFKHDTVTFLTPPSAEVQAEKYPATRSA